VSSLHGEKVLLSGNRLKAICEYKNVTQHELAQKIGHGIEVLQAIESGIVEVSYELLLTIKKHLNIENLPMTSEEIRIFKESIRLWRDLLRRQKLDDATVIRRKLSSVASCPIEPDLSLLYRMNEIMHMLVEGDLNNASKELTFCKDMIIETGDVDVEIHYYFYRNHGTLESYQGNIKVALEYFLKAFALTKDEVGDRFSSDNDSLCFNIAACYSDLYQPYQAIAFLQELYKMADDRTRSYRLHMDNTLAVSYIRINMLKEAKNILDDCLARAEASSDKLALGIILHNSGLLYEKSGNWKLALNYYDRALTYCQDSNEVHLEHLYLETQYHTIRCLMHLGDGIEAQKRMELSQRLCTNKAKYALLLETLRRLMNTSAAHSDNPIDFITRETIPFLVAEYEYAKALDYCNIARDHYVNCGDYDKAIKLAIVKEGIYEKMLFQGGSTI